MSLNLTGNIQRVGPALGCLWRPVRQAGLIVAGGLLLLMCGGCASLFTYNPATGRQEFIFISTAEENNIGRSMHQGLAQKYHFSKDTLKTQRLTKIAERVAQVSDRQDYPYQVYLIDEDELNAFTTPGGNIYVYTKLMDRLGTDDRIASVIAHEIGHCSARHIAKKFQASLGYSLLSGIVLDELGLGATAKAITSSGLNAAMQIVSSAYSRQDEYEADRLGIKYLLLSGFKPEAMTETLEILKAETKKDHVPLIVRTHPYLSDRITAAQKEIISFKTQFSDNK